MEQQEKKKRGRPTVAVKKELTGFYIYPEYRDYATIALRPAVDAINQGKRIKAIQYTTQPTDGLK